MQVRRFLTVTIAAGSVLLATACAGDELDSDSGTGSGSADKGAVTLSGQSFPEATLVASMYQLLLEDAGYAVTPKLVEARDVYMAGQFPGDVDIVAEYAGGIADFLNQRANGDDAEPITTADVTQTLDKASVIAEKDGITLLEPAEATDANAYFVTQEYSDQNGVTALSDLEGESIVLAAAPDCEGRADCEGGLSDVYGIDITKVLPLGFASAQTYESVIGGESELGQTSTTDGTLESQGLVLLEDDMAIQTAQNLVPAVSTDFLEQNPDVEELLNSLMAEITTEELTELNGRISVDREKPEDVAKDYLEEKGLL